jgi:hypothetical protein
VRSRLLRGLAIFRNGPTRPVQFRRPTFLMRIVNFSLHGTMWRAPERLRPAPPCAPSAHLAAGGTYAAVRL